ncbi:Uncharacterized protein BM_BM14699 [Brugia malayi]|uniref:Bm14699 n=1 Tax=Brugia malayi TaxID=6279 RepID=A0A0K0J1G3_BRUMA|nr:Bm14699 [Brugia malayi]VIO91076.1 Uncharacterized protein BM_BM14699 [Brugia malayi]
MNDQMENTRSSGTQVACISGGTNLNE